MKKFIERMKSFVLSGKGKAVIIVVLAAAVGAAGYQYWYYLQPKFQDLTIELGTDSVSITDFMTQYAKASKVSFVTDPSSIDIDHVGETSVTFLHGRKEETVTLHVVDTTAPAVEFLDEMEVTIDYVPDAEDFVVSVEDYSETTVSFAEAVGSVDTYEDRVLTVNVTDASGNVTSHDCTLIYTWMVDSYVLEYGEHVTKQDLLTAQGKGMSLINQVDLNNINVSGVGEYEISSTSGSKTLTCTITVADTTPPEVTLKEATVYLNKTVSVDSFIESVTDLSGVQEVRLTEEPDTSTAGTYTVEIEAEDIYGNVATAEATLYVKKDDVPPVISGLSTLTLAKHSSAPNYLSGVSANDATDGACAVSYDASSVNYNAAGTYYVTYTASDTSGNVATKKRTVVIEHDSEDTAALVASIASGLSNDVKSIADYVRSNASHNHSYGGSDPVWYGFVANKAGNCYVHAMCLKAILDYKGIESQLIWTTNKTHYWLVVNVNGTWKHVDATPMSGTIREACKQLMNDSQCLATLSGRTWDTSLWPACE
ncbi:MAG: DUF5011 domain-containing protein [Lachnospiraceae bacterium]|nr:DUF5011 domain-containing protein [Lachnospiraceae bacterium]